MRINKLSIAIISTLFTTLTSCGGGGGGSASAPIREPGQIQGKAIDAILINAAVRAYEWKDGVKQPGIIAETTTDDNGDYTLEPIFKDAFLIIEATKSDTGDTYYIEEATGNRINLVEGQSLKSIIRFESGVSINSHITIPTTLAACQAQWRARTQGNNDTDAVALSNAVFSSLVGVPIHETEPLNITDGNNATPVLNAGTRYGLYTAGWSFLSKKLIEESGLQPHTLVSTTTIHLASTIACGDIEADGNLNGQGYTPSSQNTITQLSFGTVLLTPEIYKNDMAQEMLNAAASPVNKTGLDAEDYFLAADQVSQTDSPLFNNIPGISADITGPLIELDILENTFLNNTALLSFKIFEPLGLKSLELFVDGEFVAAGSTGINQFNIDTTGYSDGLHEVKLVAVDNAGSGNTTTFIRNFNFSNSSPIAEFTSSLLTNSQTYNATGTYTENGSPIASITVNGVIAELDTINKTWKADIPLSSGINAVTINIEDEIGNIGSNVKNISVDLISPTIVIQSTQITFSAFDGQLNTCGGGQLTGTSASSTPICVSTDNVSLDGTTIDGNLQNIGFASISYSIDDGQQSGSFTSRSNLIVEYRFEQDGVEKIAWSPSPRPNLNAPLNYLPMVTEYLGENWHQISRDINNKLQVRVTDESGNTSFATWDILVDVLIPAITVSTNTSNSSLFNTGFANRVGIDNQLVNVEYLLDNPSNTAYYISLDDAAQHSVVSTYEAAIRKNKARVSVEEVWFAQKCTFNSTRGCSSITADSFAVTSAHGPSSTSTFFPASIQYTSFQDVLSDTPKVTDITGIPILPATEYSCKSSDFIGNTSDWERGRWANNDSNFVVCVFDDGNNNEIINTLTTSTETLIELDAGFPKNIITEIEKPIAQIRTESVSVFNNSIGQQIFPVSGYYRIPPKTSIRLVKAIRNPTLIHYLDAEVAATPFTSYTEKKLDFKTTWNIDTDLSITRAIDPGDVTLLSTVTQVTESFGNGIESYVVTR